MADPKSIYIKDGQFDNIFYNLKLTYYFTHRKSRQTQVKSANFLKQHRVFRFIKSFRVYERQLMTHDDVEN